MTRYISREQIKELIIKETFPYFVSTYIQHVLPEIYQYMKCPTFEQIYLYEVKQLKVNIVKLVSEHDIVDSWIDLKSYLRDESKQLPHTLFEEIAISCAKTVETLKAQMDIENQQLVLFEKSELEQNYKIALQRYKILTQFIRNHISTFSLHETSLMSIITIPNDEFEVNNSKELLRSTQFYNQQLMLILNIFTLFYSQREIPLQFKTTMENQLEKIRFILTPNEKYNKRPYIKSIKSGPNRSGIVDEIDGSIWKVAIRSEA